MVKKKRMVPEHALAMAAQTVLLLEGLAAFYTYCGDTKRLEILLKSGLSVNTRCRHLTKGITLLHLAATEGQTQVILLLLRLGADASFVIGAAGTALHQAALYCHVSTVKAMIKAGCPVEVLDSSGATVLHFAAQGGSAEVIREVLSTECNINATANGGTPLHWAAVRGKTRAVLELIRHGANRCIVAGVWGTPLHHAALYGHVSTVKAMLKEGCPVEAVDRNGSSVLHYTAVGGNAEVIREVLRTGCNINATCNDDQTPLHWAARTGKTEAVFELIRHGANRVMVAGEWGTPLHQAASYCHVSTVKAMIKAGCPVNVVSSNGATVLHAAAAGNSVVVIREVLSAGCDINARANNGGTPLHWAAASGKTEAVLELIRHRANRGMVTGVWGTPLHHAALHGHVLTVKAMLKAGCPVDVEDRNGSGILHYAAQGDNAKVIKELLTTGCDINATDNHGLTPLHLAAMMGKTSAALELIRHGANWSVVAYGSGTPLHQAVVNGSDVSTVKAMIKAGCPVDVVDSNGATVLHYAAERGSAEVIREVLRTGCNINATCNNGGTPLHWAAKKGNTETALELIRRGANRALVAGEHGTPLHCAVFSCHVSTVKALLKEGCPVDMVDSNGFSVLHAAAHVRNAEVIREVLSTNCDINATDNHGQTPLYLAGTMGNRKAALELIRHGADMPICLGGRQTPLHQAALNSDVSSVRSMIKGGCRVDVMDGNNASVLHYAASGGNVHVIREFLTTGSDINAEDNDGQTPLHFAARMGNTKAALELIRHGANMAVVAGGIGTPLHQAAVNCHVSTVKALLKAGCPVGVMARNGFSVLHAAAIGANAEVIREMLCAGCDINVTDDYSATPLHVAAISANEETLKELLRCGSIHECCLNDIDARGRTALHWAVESGSIECVRILLEHGADPRKAVPYIGSPYTFATTSVPAVVEAFDNYIVEDTKWLPCMREVLKDPWWSMCFGVLKLDRRSSLERDTFGMSHLEYMVAYLATINDEVVLHFQNLSLVKSENLLLLAAIYGLNKFLNCLSNVASRCLSFAARTVTSLVKVHYPCGAMPHLQELVPPDASLNLLHVAVLALKVSTNKVSIFNSKSGNHSSLLKWLVTNDSFRHTLHEYLPNGLTPLDLAEKLGLGDAVSIISSAGGRHGIYAMISDEVRLQHGPTILLAHQELMKLASSDPRGQQALQTLLSQLPGRTTVEQGTTTEESHIHQQKLLDQRPKLNILSNYIVSKFNVVRWRLLGTSLEVSQEVLSHISSTHSCCEDRYLEVLVYWLSHNEAANWRTLLEVLGNFETKNTLDRLTQEVLATEDSQIPPNSTTHHSEPSQHCPAEVGAALTPPSPQLSPQFIFNVVHHVGVHWYKFALHLGIGPRVLDVVRVEKQHLISDCCQESLHRWLRHDCDTGEKEREVGVVLEAVRKVCGPATVERIQSDWQSKRDRQPASPASLLLSIPELVDVEELVVPFAAAQWEAVADYLQVSYEKRAVIAASERGCVEVHCLELFKQWLQQLPGTGPLPRTWEEVLDIMGEAIGTEVAKQIRTKLDSKYGAVPCLPTQSGPTVESAALLQQDTRRTAPVDPLRGELLSSKPTAVLLLKKVVPAIAQEWLQIGVHLEMEVSLLKTFKATASHDLKLCCLEMFECWLQVSSGTGESPRTWSTVLSAVRECLGHDVADGIERALLEERRQRR